MLIKLLPSVGIPAFYPICIYHPADLHAFGLQQRKSVQSYKLS